MASTMSSRALRLLAAGLVVAGLGAGAAYATSLVAGRAVDTGVIQACKNRGNGGLRVVADNQADCHANETPISWNGVGPPGADGTSPTVTALAPGDPHCGAGGAAITDAAGTTAYVCNGASFTGTFTSPNGSFTLQVDDNGIRLGGPGNQTLTISGTEIRLKGQSLQLEAQLGARLQAGANLDLLSSGQASLHAGGTLDIQGSHVAVNGSAGCPPAARQNDLVAGNAIVGGSPQVCIGP